MTQDRYVTSNGIEKLRKKVTDEIKPVLVKSKNDIKGTDVGFPGFGILGEMLFGWKYRELMHYAEDVLGEAVTTVTKWDGALTDIKTNWRKAEDNSTPGVTVVYQ